MELCMFLEGPVTVLGRVKFTSILPLEQRCLPCPTGNYKMDVNTLQTGISMYQGASAKLEEQCFFFSVGKVADVIRVYYLGLLLIRV